MNSRATARLPLDPGADSIEQNFRTKPAGEVLAFSRPLTALVVVPTLHAGAADAGALDLVRILRRNGHRVIVASNGGRLEGEVATAGAEFVRLDVENYNPVTMLRCAFALSRIAREKMCDVIHAHGRAAAWSGYFAARIARVPLLTTWYKGFREQNALKRVYNGVMVRGERVIAVSDQIAELIVERYSRSEERRVGKECRSRWSPYH